MTISDYERLLWVLAEEIESSIAKFFQMVADEAEWVDSDNEARSLTRRLRGMFVSSLVGEIEERVGRPFSSVFEQLSDNPTPKNSKYWFVDMPSGSTPRGRAKAMWAIRIAYTHGNGHIRQVSDPDVAKYLHPEFARCHFRGLGVDGDLVQLSGDVTFPALKTALEINEKLTR
jgi:hypothetical protein